jgi:hypothetical protein
VDSAFSYVAFTGEDFIAGSKNSYLMKVLTKTEFEFSYYFAWFIIFISKVSVVWGNVFIYNTLLHDWLTVKHDVTSTIGPSLIVGLTTWIITSIFLSMIEIAFGTMMTCYSIDYFANKGDTKWGPEVFGEAIADIYQSELDLEKKSSKSTKK